MLILYCYILYIVTLSYVLINYAKCKQHRKVEDTGVKQNMFQIN